MLEQFLRKIQAFESIDVFYSKYLQILASQNISAQCYVKLQKRQRRLSGDFE